MKGYTLSDLEHWSERIREQVGRFHLDVYPQEFEICDYHQMLGYMAYSGMPSHYSHWSFGKSFERQKTVYDYGVSGLPYELVINSNPCLAYLMRDNTLLLQILTMAHVFGHNDFFRNNFLFQFTRPELVLDMFKRHARRIRRYIEDPHIGIDRVEAVMDAAHALAFQCRRNPAAVKLAEPQQRRRIEERHLQQRQKAAAFGRRVNEEAWSGELRKSPLQPEEDLLLFIRDRARYLEEWQRDVITIVDERTRYFLPQIETKVMNEGWASFWHKKILDTLELPPDLHMEFLVRHSQVLAPHRARINPYHVGYMIWDSLRIWYDGCLDRSSLRREELDLFEKMAQDFEERDAVPADSGCKSSSEVLFQARETDRDTSFIRRYLTPVLMRELDLFEYQPKRERDGRQFQVVTETSGGEGWKEVKETLIHNLGLNSFPVIRVEDENYRRNATLLLSHLHDGRDLDLEASQKTLLHVQQLWGGPVVLQTCLEDKSACLEVDPQGQVAIKAPHQVV